MSNFERRLNRILAEMPLSYRIAGERDAQGRPWEYDNPDANAWGSSKELRHNLSRFNQGRTSANEPREPKFKAWTSPKFLGTLSHKLSRLTSHNILLFIGGNIHTPQTSEHAPRKKEQYLHQISMEKTGLSQEELNNSIVVNIIGSGGGKDPASPWIILHQVGEALVGGGRRNSPMVEKYGLKSSKRSITGSFFEEIWINLLQEHFKSFDDAYKALFKFKSAQNPRDVDAELLVEYMWHGGKVRMNQPPGVPPEVLVKVKWLLEQICNDVLDNAVGGVYSNSQRA